MVVSAMVVSTNGCYIAMKCGLFGKFASGKERKNSGTVVKLPQRKSNSCVWLVLIVH